MLGWRNPYFNIQALGSKSLDGTRSVNRRDLSGVKFFTVDDQPRTHTAAPRVQPVGCTIDNAVMTPLWIGIRQQTLDP